MKPHRLQQQLEEEKEKYESLERSYNQLLENFKEHSLIIQEELEKRKKIEKSLIAQKTFLNQIIDLNPSFIFAKNYQGEFTLANESLARAYGSTPIEIIGKTDADFATNKQEADKFRADDLQVMNSQKEQIIENEVLTDPKGNVLHLKTVKRAIINEEGKTTHVLGVATDITQLINSQKQTSLLAEIVKSSNDAIALISFEGHITCWNKAAESMFGYSHEQVIGLHIDSLCSKKFVGIGKVFLKKIVHGEKIKNVQIKGLRNDGSVFDMEVTISAVKDSDGKITGTSAIARDNSKRIATEKELELHRKKLSKLLVQKTRKLSQSQQRLRRAERLAAMGSLASGIAHEINNPIGAIVLTAENNLEASKECSSCLDIQNVIKEGNQKIIKNAHRCSLIIKEALKFASTKSVPKKLCDFNHLIENAVQLVSQYRDSKGCNISMQLDRSLPKILANPLEIEQLLVNIIQNSFESSENPVQVIIKAKQSKNKKFIISIIDDGLGIPKNKKNRIFEPFYSSKKSQGGTGLGLSIAQQIVNSHKGTITLKNSVTRPGTTCTITLPIITKKELNKNYSDNEKDFKKELTSFSTSADDQNLSSASFSAASKTIDSSGTTA